MSAATVQPVVPPCPHWCIFEAGHPYKDLGREMLRTHCGKDIGEWAQICAHESMVDGILTLGTPYINVYADAEELTAEQALDVIEALQMARRKLGAINGT